MALSFPQPLLVWPYFSTEVDNLIDVQHALVLFFGEYDDH